MIPVADQPNQELCCVPTESRNLTDDERRAVYDMMLKSLVNGKPKYGSQTVVATHFGISKRTVARIWKRGAASFADGAVAANVSSKMKGAITF